MRKLTSLVRHIQAETKIPRENIKAYADLGTVMPIGRELAPLRYDDTGEILAQVDLGLFQYSGSISIERYPGPGLDFVALVSTWIIENDSHRPELGDPEIDIDLNLITGECDVQISVDFEERLAAVEDNIGNIPFLGKRWSLAEPQAPPATSLVFMNGSFEKA